MGRKNYPLVEDLPYSRDVRYYIATQMELEAALTNLLEQLESAGIMDDTVIVVASDHYPYGLDSDEVKRIDELMGVTRVDDFSRDRNTLIIWSGCVEDMDIVVDAPVSSLDILPTLSNLFGVPYDSRLMVGRDVFSEAEPLVFWGISKSWRTDKGSYLDATGVFTPAEGVEVEEGYADRIHAIVRDKIKYSQAVAKYDYFNAVYAALEALAEAESSAAEE
jgi:arylsulfatase A-like enzyme